MEPKTQKSPSSVVQEIKRQILPLPNAPEIPYKADSATVDRVKNMGGWSWGY